MKIKADEEGTKMIQTLCDAALKIGGIQNLNAVNMTLSTIKPIEEPKKPKKEKDNG